MSPAQGIAGAIEENLYEYLAWLGRVRGGESHIAPDVRWAYSGCPVLNFVFAARFEPSQVEASIERVLEKCRQWGQLVFWITGPSSRPGDLASHLAAYGFEPRPPCIGMAMDLAQLPEDALPVGFTVKRVSDPDELSTWAGTWVRDINLAFPLLLGDTFHTVFRELGLGPRLPWTHYLGFAGGSPVATCTVFVHADVIGLYWVKTVPEMRRQGLATTICRHALREAASAGGRLAVLHSTPMGEGVYRKLGFQEHCRFGWFVWKPEQLRG